MSRGIRFWLAPIVVLACGIVPAAVVCGEETKELPVKYYKYLNGFGAGGYDVVAYFAPDQDKATPGKDGITAEYDGQVWRFANAENRAKFLEEPRRYIPQYGGHCAYTLAHEQPFLVRGNPQIWTIKDDKLYFITSEKFFKGWFADFEYYIVHSEKNWPILSQQ